MRRLLLAQQLFVKQVKTIEDRCVAVRMLVNLRVESCPVA